MSTFTNIYLLTVIILLAIQGTAMAAWQIQYSERMRDGMASGGYFCPKRDEGRYNTKRECQEAINRAVRESRDPSLAVNMSPVGYDEQKSPKPKLQGIDPFGDSLFYDVPIIPEDGKLKTRHLDPNGLAAKAEAWGREMKQIDQRSRQKQDARVQALAQQKQDLLENPRPQLSNIFADPNVVRLDGDDLPSPSLLREADSGQGGNPIFKSESNPLAEMSDERLEEKRQSLTKAMSEIQKLQTDNVLGYADVEAGGRAGKDDARAAAEDAFITVTCGAAAEPISLARTLGDVWSGKIDASDAAVTAALSAAGLFVKTSAKVNPMVALPGVTKLAWDTGLVWTDYVMLSGAFARKEALRKKHDADILYLTTQQMRVIEEQNQRKAAASQGK